MNLAIDSLYRGQWFKLICGASFHHLPSIQRLTQIYTLAGVDCIDLAADPAIVEAAQAGIAAAHALKPECGMPLLMASVNDGEDPHFRKARISSPCPATCPQPCLSICPPHAIEVLATASDKPGASSPSQIQIMADLCYGCGRCVAVCPEDLIWTQNDQRPAADQMSLLWQAGVRALEIHTQVGRLAEFRALWSSLQPWIPRLQVVSVSLGNGLGLEDYLWDLVRVMVPPPPHLIWQLDGRPMSGDIGVGTTRATLQLAQQVARWQLPGILQLAGGTNQVTVAQISADHPVGGVAYGSYARQLVAFATEGEARDRPQAELDRAVELAQQLVGQIKSRSIELDPEPWPSWDVDVESGKPAPSMSVGSTG